MPEDLRAMMGTRALYFQADSNQRPQVGVESVDGAAQHVWRINVPVSDELRGARPGRTMERHPATKFLAEVSEGASFTSYRPAWADALPVPRLMLERNVRTFRRFNGRRVRPLWVYDSARHAFQDSF